MAIADTRDARHPPARHVLLRLRRRAAEWLNGEHALTQRMAGTAFTIRVASAAIMFASQVLLARWMGDAEFGIYVYVWTWLLVVGDTVHLGMPLTAQRFVPEYTQGQSFNLLRGFLLGSRWITFALATAAAFAGALIVRAVEASLDSHVILPFYLACAALPFFAFTFMIDALARSYNWISLALLPPYVVRPLLVIAGLAAVHIAGLAIDATIAMAVLAGATWLTALAQLVQLNRRLKAAVARGPRAYDVRLWLGTALPVIFVWGMYTLLTSADILVLKQFRPAEEVAHYYAAAKTLALVSIIHFAVAAVSAHRFTAYHVAGDRAGLAAFAAETIRWVFWPSLAACLIVIALGRPVLMLFGEGFVEGYPVMAILALGQLARASIGPAERLINMLGEQRICALAYAAAFAFNIASCVLLTPRYGSIGAAAATAGAFMVESALLFAIAHRRLGLHMFVWHPPFMLREAAPANAQPGGGAITVETASDARLAEIDADWRDLIARADAANVFMHPALLRCARLAHPQTHHVALLAWQEVDGKRRLVGLWAFAIGRPPRSILPVTLLSAPPMAHAYLATPVIDRDRLDATLAAMFEHIANDVTLPKMVALDAMTADTATMQALDRVLSSRGGATCVFARTPRPTLDSTFDAKQYLEQALSASSRKKLRQHRRRLGEKGALESRVVTAPEAVRAAFEDFLTLEASGWKGRQRTALLDHAADAAFARAMISELAEHGEASIHALTLDGKPVSMQIVLRAGASAFTWKTAYDEAFHDVSPGMLLFEDYTTAFLADKTIAHVDSCAFDDSGFMAAWRERQTIAHLWFDVRRGGSRTFSVLASLQSHFLSLRAFAKSAYYAAKRRWAR